MVTLLYDFNPALWLSFYSFVVALLWFCLNVLNQDPDLFKQRYKAAPKAAQRFSVLARLLSVVAGRAPKQDLALHLKIRFLTRTGYDPAPQRDFTRDLQGYLAHENPPPP